MDQLRRVLDRVKRFFSGLSVSHKLLIGALGAVMLLTLVVVAQFASRREFVELFPGAAPEMQLRAGELLDARGVEHRIANGRVLVPQDRRRWIVAQLGQEGALPSDTTLLFDSLVDKQSWTMSNRQAKQLELIALQNELSQVIRRFDGVRDARVLIDAPEAAGLGSAVRQPTASATVFTSSGTPLSQNTVDAVASLIAGARAGLDVMQVRVIDGNNNRQLRARSDDAAIATTYLEHAASVEDRTRDRLLNLLSYIPGVVVAVSAQVDVRQTVVESSKVLDAGKGTVTAPKRESTQDSSQGQRGRGAEPGVRSNVGLDIARADGGASSFSENTSDAEFVTEFGRVNERTVDPRGMPLKINATVNIPRSYFSAVWSNELGPDAPEEPDPAELDAVVRRETDRIRADIQPLVDASADAMGEPGEVVVSMIPDAGNIAAMSPAMSVAGMGGGGSGFSMSGETGELIKTGLLAGLAIGALGMMVVLVKRAGKADPLPSAHDIVGVPRSLAEDADMVGEADEADNALAGIELSDEMIRSRKLLEQVQEMVADSPDDAASLLGRWIQTDD